MSISTSRGASTGYERVPVAARAAAARPAPALFRRQSLQPSRRAVLHVQAAGDPAAPADLADWFTERAFHFYLAGLRLPGRVLPATRPGSQPLEPAFADLDAACARLRTDDGIRHVIVTAQGRGALAAALWSHARTLPEAAVRHRHPAGNGADALVLYEPELPARPVLSLAIGCPVLVVTGEAAAAGQVSSRGRRGLRLRRTGAASAELGSHVTWLRLREPGQSGTLPESADHQALLDELGRWLGAYMYGPVRDQLL